MLPLRHSNRNNEMRREASASLVRKSDRASLKAPTLPYNGSASYYLNNNAPPIVRHSTPVEPVTQFRQRPRSTYLQDPNRLSVPGHSSFTSSSYTPSYASNGSGFGSSLSISPINPPSPGLDQVLTDIRPGPNVVWFCERKREKSKLWTYRKHLVSLLLLIMAGIILYKGMSASGELGARTGHHLEVEDETFQESIVNAQIYEETHVEEMEQPGSVILAAHVATEEEFVSVPKSVPGATIKILYSVNEDLESTVEVIEG